MNTAWPLNDAAMWPTCRRCSCGRRCRSRPFSSSVRLMGLTEVAREGTSLVPAHLGRLRTVHDQRDRGGRCLHRADVAARVRPGRCWPAGSAPSRRPATASAGPMASRGSEPSTRSVALTATSSGSTGRAYLSIHQQHHLAITRIGVLVIKLMIMIEYRQQVIRQSAANLDREK